MSGGKNGRTPFENLAHLRTVPDLGPEPVMSKCVAHPTKRAWDDEIEAAREAVARSQAARIHIVAIRCGACKRIHLCKAANAAEGTVIELPSEPDERTAEVLPLVPGNAGARRKMLAAWLGDKERVATAEIIEQFGFGRKTTMVMMRELGWQNGTGRSARWRRIEPAVPAASAQVTATGSAQLEAAIARHPASSGIAWRDFLSDPVRHQPLGDILDTLLAAGMEVRIQVRSPR